MVFYYAILGPIPLSQNKKLWSPRKIIFEGLVEEENKTKQGWGELHEINQKKWEKSQWVIPNNSALWSFLFSPIFFLFLPPSDARSAESCVLWGLWAALILNQLSDFRGSSPAKTQRHGVPRAKTHSIASFQVSSDGGIAKINNTHEGQKIALQIRKPRPCQGMPTDYRAVRKLTYGMKKQGLKQLDLSTFQGSDESLEAGTMTEASIRSPHLSQWPSKCLFPHSPA